MYKTFLRKFELLSEEEEGDALQTYGRTCYCGYYPFRFFLNKKFRTINCAPVTILYGSNGSGKSTVLNVMAARLISFVIRYSTVLLSFPPMQGPAILNAMKFPAAVRS